MLAILSESSLGAMKMSRARCDVRRSPAIAQKKACVSRMALIYSADLCTLSGASKSSGSMNSPFAATENPRLQRINRHKLCHRCTRFCDDHLFSHGNPFQQTREMSLGFVNVDLHKIIMD